MAPSAPVSFLAGSCRACSALAFIYLVGLAVIWLAPETRGKALPE